MKRRTWMLMLTGTLAVGLVASVTPRTRAEDPQTPGATTPDATTGTITGKVTDKDGNPVEKATVKIAKAPVPKQQGQHKGSGAAAEPGSGAQSASGLDSTSHPAPPTSMPKPVQTGADGTYTIESVPPGQYIVSATGKGGMAKSDVQTVQAGQTLNVDLKLEPRQSAPKHPTGGGAAGGGGGGGGMGHSR